jgi:hypothetical protein
MWFKISRILNQTSRSQSYDRELQRQRFTFWQRHGWPSAFLKQIYFLLLLKNALAYYNAGVVVVNLKVVGSVSTSKRLDAETHF